MDYCLYFPFPDLWRKEQIGKKVKIIVFVPPHNLFSVLGNYWEKYLYIFPFFEERTSQNGAIVEQFPA